MGKTRIMEKLKDKIDYINTLEAKHLSRDMQKILSTPADYYSKVASSLRVALTELPSGGVTPLEIVVRHGCRQWCDRGVASTI